jgi:hypothetical protein
MEKRSPSSSGPSINAASDAIDIGAIKETSIPHHPSDPSIETATAGNEDYKYVTGLKLTFVMISVTLVGFLMMLDTSIIATVRFSLGYRLLQIIHSREATFLVVSINYLDRRRQANSPKP